MAKIIRHKKHSFSLVEVIIDVAVIGTIGLAILSLSLTNLRSASFSQAKAAAANLANQKLEEVHNLKYEDIGTKNPDGSLGPVPGEILSSEDQVFSGFSFRLITGVYYFNDPSDNDVNGNDSNPNDYKKITVTVFRSQNLATPIAELSTSITSRVAETTGANGMLIVDVVDDTGHPVESASVTVTNASLAGFVTRNGQTDTDGKIIFSDLPQATDSSYSVSIQKTGYATISTVSPTECDSTNVPGGEPPEATANPNITTQNTTIITIQIRCLSNLEITITDSGGVLQPNTAIHIRSSRRRCTDPLKTVYDQWKASDDNGKILINELEHDTYNYYNQ